MLGTTEQLWVPTRRTNTFLVKVSFALGSRKVSKGIEQVHLLCSCALKTQCKPVLLAQLLSAQKPEYERKGYFGSWNSVGDWVQYTVKKAGGG